MGPKVWLEHIFGVVLGELGQLFDEDCELLGFKHKISVSLWLKGHRPLDINEEQKQAYDGDKIYDNDDVAHLLSSDLGVKP